MGYAPWYQGSTQRNQGLTDKLCKTVWWWMARFDSLPHFDSEPTHIVTEVINGVRQHGVEVQASRMVLNCSSVYNWI